MAYSFEKIKTKTPEPEPEIPEKTQEQFDLEIEKEAEKLKVSLESLKTEIDEFGGPEKFKEYFEKADMFGSVGGKDVVIQNKAGGELNYLSHQEKREKSSAKTMAKVAALCYGISVLVAVGIHEGGDIGGGVMAGLMFIVGSGSLIGSIKDRLNACKLNRQKKKEELKFKMTGTEVIG